MDNKCVDATSVTHTSLITRTVTAFRQCVTTSDNQTHSPWKWSLVISMGSVIFHDFYQVFHGVPVNVRDFAIALAAVIAGSGIGVSQGKDQ